MDKRPRRGWREGSAVDDESQENQNGWREGVPRMKSEGNSKGLRLKREEEEGEGAQDDRVGDLDSAPSLSLNKLSIISNKGTDSNSTNKERATKRQRPRQFTFKVNQPPGSAPAPSPSSSSVWNAKVKVGVQGQNQLIQSPKTSSPAMFRTQSEQAPPN